MPKRNACIIESFSQFSCETLLPALKTHFASQPIPAFSLTTVMPTAAPPEPPSELPTTVSVPTVSVLSNDLCGKLKWYYARIFPLSPFTRWLRYGSDDTLSRREISFTLQGDIYLRWKSFPTSTDFQKALKTLNPIKIDIGAIYNYPPVDKNTVSAPLTPLEKELVFDIDMTDYEDVMGDLATGSAVEVCDRNWQYMTTAVKVLDAALRCDFGFERILWVYSGRRGIHCWVADARARRMTNEQRVAVADYLYLRFEGRENAGRRQHEVTVPLHPSLTRAKRIACDQTFRDFVLGEQGMLNTEERVKAMTSFIPNRAIADALCAKVAKASALTGVEKWERIEKELARSGKNDYGVRTAADYILFKHTYPRLDVNVSKEINHLLKAPFCVHPKTGRVCVPFRAAEVEKFVPGVNAPEVGRLLAEMKEADGVVKGSGPAWDTMREAIEVFEEFVKQVEMEVRANTRIERLEEMDKRQAMELVSD